MANALQSKQIMVLDPALAASAGAVTLTPEEDFGQTGRFRCYAECGVTILCSAGEQPRRLGQAIPEMVEEYLEFALTATASLSRPARGDVALEWVGLNRGAFSLREGEVVLPAPVVGVLRARYRTTYSRWELPASARALAHVVVVAMCQEALAALGVTPEAARLGEAGALSMAQAVDWNGDPAATRLSVAPEPEVQPAPEAGEPVTYTLTVLDYCTGDPVPGATVSSAYGGGEADGQGQVTIGPMPVGARVDLRISAPGYQDSHSDTLNNDYFIA